LNSGIETSVAAGSAALVAGANAIYPAPVKARVMLLLAAILALSGSASSRTSAPPAAIAAGGDYTCALLTTHALECWGRDDFGMLGDGSAVTQQKSPVGVAGLSSGVEAVSTGDGHACALLGSGGVECWGYGNYGQLGNGRSGDDELSRTPAGVIGLSTGVAQVVAGGDHTCALLRTGGVECWGNDEYGQLGDGHYDDEVRPVAVKGLAGPVRAIAAGADHTCALTGASGVECWGTNSEGELGTGTSDEDSAVPVPVAGLSSGVEAISAGGYSGADHTCALLRGGIVECWGFNEDGELGDGTTTSHSTPAPVSALGSGVRSVVAGHRHTCAIVATGRVECWGKAVNARGALIAHHAPVVVAGLPRGIQAISAGGGHTCALAAGGRVDCWGQNLYGQLGDGRTNDRGRPVPVRGLYAGVLTVRVRGRGTVSGPGIRCPKGCTAEHAPGTKVPLVARPARGQAFRRWSGACHGRRPRCAVVLRSDTVVTAQFARRRRTRR
jgi:alpha-tubulin suppressor-like RCC1 family protein